MKEQWIEQLRQKMAGYEEPAPEVSWVDIEQALAGQKQQIRVVPMWLRSIAAAILVMVVAVVGYKALEKDKLVSEVSQQKEYHGGNRGEKSLKSLKGSETTITQPVPAVHWPQPVPTVHMAKVSQKAGQTLQIEPTAEVAEAELETIPENNAEEEHIVEPANAPSEPVYYPSDLYKSPASKNRVTAKLYLSNGVANSDQQKTFMYSLSDNNIYTKEYIILNLSSSDNTDNSIITHNAHHHQPIRFGFSLRYHLAERWAMEAGLTYSLLISDITNTYYKYFYRSVEQTQRLNYIGIPLKAEYLLWENRHFNVYVAGGGTVEKMVRGSLENLDIKETKSVSIHPLQFSVNSGIGAEYKYNNLFSIYVEPAIGYYFNNGSSVSTFYQDKPLNLNLNVGVRLQINDQ